MALLFTEQYFRKSYNRKYYDANALVLYYRYKGKKVMRIYIYLESSYRGGSCIFSAILGGRSANFLVVKRGWVIYFLKKLHLNPPVHPPIYVLTTALKENGKFCEGDIEDSKQNSPVWRIGVRISS